MADFKDQFGDHVKTRVFFGAQSIADFKGHLGAM